RGGDVRQQPLRRRRPRTAGNDGIRKHALRGGEAAARVVRLARRDRVAETPREQLCPVRTVNRPAQHVRGGREVARALGSRGDRDETGFYPLGRSRRLVIGEEERAPLLQRSADRASGLLLHERGMLRREIASSVQRGVADEVEQVAMQRLGAGLGHDGDDAAVVIAYSASKVLVSTCSRSIESRFGTIAVPPFIGSCTLLPLSRKPFADSR